ncbi:MAG: hypothetical protein M3276_03170 [Actinomycetota bacterium]|nr:hypothetical protein [Actinomycetota bacterium]
MPPAAQTRNLGPAIVGFPIVGAELVDGRVYAVSRNLVPSVLAVYDLQAAAVTASVDVPTGAGAWGMTAGRADDVYFGQFGARGQANLYRLELASNRLEAVAALDVQYIWDLATTADGKVYGVTSPDIVFEYDPATRLARDLGVIAHPPEALRSVAAAGRTVFVGGNTSGRAMLLAVDPVTGQRSSILPAQLADHGTVYTLATSERFLAAGTRGPGAVNPALAVQGVGDRALVASVDVPGEEVIDAIAVAGEEFFFTARTSGTLYRYDLSARRLDNLATPVANAETRGMFFHQGKVVGASASGAVWTHDPPTGVTLVFDLLEAGLTPRPELAQSITAGGGTVYVGGNFGFQRHDLASGRSRRLFAGGEPKDMAIGAGTLYLALYPGAEIWQYVPDGDPARKAAQLPVQQNRPAAAHVDPDSGRVLVSTSSDRLGGGALHVYNPATARQASYVNPFGDSQFPAGVTSADRAAFIGGSGPDPSLAGWNLDAGQKMWQLDRPVPGAEAMVGLVALDGRLYGYTVNGWFVVVDLTTASLVHHAQVPHRGGGLAVSGGFIYGVDREALFRFHPQTFQHEVVLTGLGAQIWGWPSLAADGQGDLYVIKGTDLLQVQVQG